MAKRKPSGRYCRICDSYRPNEAFSGKGHRRCVCRQCSRKPKEELDAIDKWNEVDGFLYQSIISQRNIARLRELSDHADRAVADAAKVVLAIALVHPGKRRRMRRLERDYPELFQKLDALGMVPEYYLESEEFLRRQFLEVDVDHSGGAADEDDWIDAASIGEFDEVPF